MGGISDSLSGHFIWKYKCTLEFTLASQRSFLQKTNECFNRMKMVCCKLMRIGNNYDRKQVSAISSSWKITTLGTNFTFCWFWLKNALKLFELHVFRFNGTPNSMALVLSIYTKWFMKNHNFRRHIVEKWGSKPWTWDRHMQQSSLGPILPLHHVSQPYILTIS